uniref:Dimer_Tnp_hAT domain-containing protein n=1 Tax=Meloidogyne hapla TaxID=6305 RepID=A0A1I8BS78_MELHA
MLHVTCVCHALNRVAEEANFSSIPTSIQKLEAQGLTLAESLDILGELRSKIAQSKGQIGESVLKKFNNVLEKNPASDLKILIDVAKVLTGGESEFDLEPDKIASLKYAPITSVDVERSFSAYKSIITEKRTSLTPENIEIHLICYCENRNQFFE